MTKVIVDKALRRKLHNLTEPLVLCDERGRVLATVVPRDDSSEYDLDPGIDRAEIRRRMASKEKGFTTAEVIAKLEKL
jgi:hypothetical protein